MSSHDMAKMCPHKDINSNLSTRFGRRALHRRQLGLHYSLNHLFGLKGLRTDIFCVKLDNCSLNRHITMCNYKKC